MTFTPNAGLWSREDFSTSSGATISNPDLQTITGGYVSLLPQVHEVTLFNTSWTSYTGWNIENGMESRSVVTGTFLLSGGREHGLGTTAIVTGYQKPFYMGGSWEIYSPQPGPQYSGTDYQEVSVRTGQWKNLFDSGSVSATIEVDVMSTYDPYSGLQTLQGFVTGQENTTGLPSLSGVLCHGIYINNGTTWDYIEILPYGIRSANHPELAIPFDLTSPRRLRIGINNQDLYFLTEDGRSLAGLGRFNTSAVNGTARLAFGAVSLSGSGGELTGINVSGTAGHTYWGNFKLVVDDLVLQIPTDISQYYSITPSTLYTSIFDPTIPIERYVSATIGFIPYRGGNSTVTVQYSGTTGFIDSAETVTITDSSISPVNLDLSSIPIRSYPFTDSNSNIIHNPIRFKITQSSNNGTSPAPAIDYIDLNATAEKTFLDLIPNWRPFNKNLALKATISTGYFLEADPVAGLWTNLLFNTPNITGLTDGPLTDQSKNDLDIELSGTHEIYAGGRFGNYLQNYIYNTIIAQSGSEAANYFGSTPITNIFPNPYFNEPFEPVAELDNFVSGKVFGEIAPHLYIPSTYTGSAIIEYSKQSIIRPVSRARESRLTNLFNIVGAGTNDWLQSVRIPAYSNDLHDGTVGIEARVPSGAATATMLAEMDLQVSHGTNLTIYISGAATSKQWNLDGSLFRTFRQIGFPITATSSGEIRIGLVVTSGSSLDEELVFNIDNLIVAPIELGYSYVTGLTADIHRSGLADTAIISSPTIQRAATIFNTDLYLDSYPANNGYIIHCTGTDSRGFSLSILGDGRLSGNFDTQSNAWATGVGAAGFINNLDKEYIISNEPVPLGRWTNVGFIHQADPYDYFGRTSYTGAIIPLSFTSNNRAYLTIDGKPVQSIDCMRSWTGNHIGPSSLDSAPFMSYIPLTGDVRAVLFSGMPCSFDAVHLERPPIADAEVALSIKGSRVSAPYFSPSLMTNGTVGPDISNVLYDPANTTTFGYDTFMGSNYSFGGPGYTCWDHGPLRNHLLFSGNVLKDTISPYSGLDSTRFLSDGYAIAKYHSSIDRWINTATTHGFVSLLGLANQNFGRFVIHGWMYPRTTGRVFTLVEDESNFTGSRLQYSIGGTGDQLILERYHSDGSQLFSYTGGTVTFDEWNWNGFDYLMGTITGSNTTGSVSLALFDNDSYTVQPTGISGLNYTFKYRGQDSDTQSSAFIFGNGADINLCDWSFTLPPVNSVLPTFGSWISGDKSGRYQALIENYSLFTGDIDWTHYYTGIVYLPAANSPSDRFLWIAAHNSYDSNAKFNGGVSLYSDRLFKDSQAYFLYYDTSALLGAFGATDSPIRLGYSVPPDSINIARIDSEELTVEGSINTIDLASTNINNLTSYRDGEYTITRSSGPIVPTQAVSNISGNHYQISGRADVTYSGDLVSDNIEMSLVSISDTQLSTPAIAYYCYLLGRGRYGVSVPNTQIHDTGNLLSNTSGDLADIYIANLEAIRNSITLKNSNGELISSDEYPYDLVISPYNPTTLYEAIENNDPLHVDGINIGTGDFSGLLPDHIYSVLLLTNKRTIGITTSVWAHYSSYDFNSTQLNPSHKEIVNPIPLYRKTDSFEDPVIGRYTIHRDTSNQKYNLIFYGMSSGYSGTI